MAVVSGNGVLVGTDSGDTITGGTGSDALVGESGTDTLNGGGGDDVLNPENYDSFWGDYDYWSIGYYSYASDDGYVDHVNGGAGYDKVVFRLDGTTTNISVDLSNSTVSRNLAGSTVINVEEFHLVLGSGSDTITLGLGHDLVKGGTGNDTINGGDGFDELHGDGGNDILSGGNGNDYLYGNDGDDRLTGGAGDDRIDGGAGNDTLILSGNRADYLLSPDAASGFVKVANLITGEIDYINSAEIITFADGSVTAATSYSFTLTGTDNNESMIGTYLNDTIDGAGGNDNLYAYEGNDTLNGGGGNDTLSGMDGDDTLNGGDGDDSMHGGLGNDVLDGGAGFDRVTLQFGQALSGAIYAFSNGNVTTPEGTDSLSNFEAVTIYGSAHADTFTGGSAADQIWGRNGEDTLNGADGDDALYGEAGNDTLNGGAGNDSLSGEAGNDILNGNEGDDYLYGGLGDDIVDGGDGVDVTNLDFWSTSGVTYTVADGAVATSSGTKTLIGIEGADMSGSDFADTLTGGSAGEQIYGRNGNDVLNGAGGNDRLMGDSGDDTLNGGDGDDILDGGQGNDSLYGGAGNDTFQNNLGNDTIDGGDGIDRAMLEFYNSGVGITYALGNNSVTTSNGIKTLANIEGADIFGSNSADTFTGGSATDRLYGRNGNDALNGGDGDDFLYGESGNDTLNGGLGNDHLDGGQGSNILNGLDGNDTLLAQSTGTQTLSGGAGNDSLTGNGTSTTAVYSGGFSDYSLTADGGSLIVADQRAGAADGTDTLLAVGTLRFADGTYNVATGTFTRNPNQAPEGADEQLTIAEDGVHIFGASDFNFSDIDGDALAGVVIVVPPANGTLWLNGVQVTGVNNFVSLEDINAGKLSYVPDANENGDGHDFLTFKVRDNGGTANGGVDTDPNADTVSFNVAPVNDAPVVTITTSPTLGGMAMIAEWTDYENQTGELPALPWGTSDLDGANRIGLSVTFANGLTGTVIYDNVAGLWNSYFTGIDAEVATGFFTGAEGMHFLFADGSSLPIAWEDFVMPFSGNFDLDYSDQLGSHFRASEAGWTSAVFRTFSSSEAQAGTFAALEQVEHDLKGSINVSDVDGGTGVMTVTLSVDHGILNVAAGSSGAEVSGSGSDAVTITGTMAQINDLLGANATSRVGYVATGDAPPASSTLTVSVNDGGNTGSGGAQVGASVESIVIAPVNDAPAGTDAVILVSEDDAYALTASDFGFADADGGSFAGLVVTTLATNGMLTLNGVAIGAGTFVTAGQIAAGQFEFRPDANEHGSPYGSFTFQLRDNGGTVSGGVDTDQTANTITFSVSADPIEGGPSDETLGGTSGNDVIYGNGGDDTLEGGDGNDLLDGGEGSDTASYATAASGVTISLAMDAAQETGGAGTDTLSSIENLTGSQFADALTGDAGDNRLSGLDGDDLLMGGAGEDLLDGGGGADLLIGGLGNDEMQGGAGHDRYLVDGVGDVVLESAGEGDDWVLASGNYTLAEGVHVETLTTSNAASIAPINLTGNELGQSIYGNAGDNMLTGNGGADYLVGGLGDDRYYVDTSDFILEEIGGGDDWIFVASSYTLREGNEIETLVAVNQDSLDTVNFSGNEFGQSLYGSQGANQLHGGGGNDYLVGLGGNDFLIGGAGDDHLAGGTGNDLYYADGGDLITESAGEGDDLAVALDSLVLGSGQSIETLSAAEGSANINLTGNGLAQSLYGNAGDNILTTGGGSDYMVGGAGSDTFFISNAPGIATIADYAAGEAVDVTQWLSVANGTDVVGGGYLRVTGDGQLQVDATGGGDAWTTIATISGSSAVTIRYLAGGSATDLTVARSGQAQAMESKMAAQSDPFAFGFEGGLVADALAGDLPYQPPFASGSLDIGPLALSMDTPGLM
jgi:Ca2+-binding RTX toxin-like protein